MHNCFKNVQFTAANGTSTIKGKHRKMHFSSKTHKCNLCIWQLIWALSQTFHRVEKQNSGKQIKWTKISKFKPKSASLWFQINFNQIWRVKRKVRDKASICSTQQQIGSLWSFPVLWKENNFVLNCEYG